MSQTLSPLTDRERRNLDRAKAQIQDYLLFATTLPLAAGGTQKAIVVVKRADRSSYVCTADHKCSCPDHQTRGERCKHLWMCCIWHTEQRRKAAQVTEEQGEETPPAAPAEPAVIEAEIITATVPKSLHAIFTAALANVRFPRLTFTVGGETLIFRLAGDKSRNPGSISVTDDGRYPDNRFFGAIGTDGFWNPSSSCPDHVAQIVAEVLADPAGQLALYGQTSGYCACCGRQLTDPRSLAVGYGATCAAHWDLPWGETPTAAPDAVYAPTPPTTPPAPAIPTPDTGRERRRALGRAWLVGVDAGLAESAA